MIGINGLVDVGDWRYVDSRNMIPDVGTRKGMTLEDMGSESEWINGMSWMRGAECDFPVKTAAEIVLGGEGKNEANKETIVIDILENGMTIVPPFLIISISRGSWCPLRLYLDTNIRSM